MANSFLTPAKLSAPKPKVRDRFPAEVKQENTRLTGVSRRLIGGYQETPARMLPKSKSLGNLRRMMGGGRKAPY